MGIVSSRNIERACYEDLAFRVLTANQQPDHTRISGFRRRHLQILEGLFLQVLQLCQKAGKVSLRHVALDGTKVETNASKHKAMSYERMLKAEEQLRQEMRTLLRKAEILDAHEDGKYGKDKQGDELPVELQRRTDRLERIRCSSLVAGAERTTPGATPIGERTADAEAASAEVFLIGAVEDIGRVAEAAGHPLTDEGVGGRITIQQVAQEPTGARMPTHAPPVHHLGVISHQVIQQSAAAGGTAEG